MHPARCTLRFPSRSRFAVAVAALVTVMVLASACGADDEDGGAVTEAPSFTTVATQATPGATTAAPVAEPEPTTVAPTVITSPPPVETTTVNRVPDMVPVVGVATEVFVDGSRPTNAVVGLVDAAPSRTIPTMV